MRYIKNGPEWKQVNIKVLKVFEKNLGKSVVSNQNNLNYQYLDEIKKGKNSIMLEITLK